jgi:transcriptional regulator with XRE-family HTH domain
MENAVDLEAVSRSVGADLRALRKGRGLTLTELAVRLGRSVGWLSQVERGMSEPSISDLRNLAGIFDVSVSFFFANEDAPADERGLVVRADARRSLGDPANGLTEELLSPDLGGEFEMLRSVFAPGAELPEFQTRDTEEAGYLVSGSLDLWIGARLFRLRPGDSFRFSREPYRWRNPGIEEAVVIWTITPPVY